MSDLKNVKNTFDSIKCVREKPNKKKNVQSLINKINVVIDQCPKMKDSFENDNLMGATTWKFNEINL